MVGNILERPLGVDVEVHNLRVNIVADSVTLAAGIFGKSDLRLPRRSLREQAVYLAVEPGHLTLEEPLFSGQLVYPGGLS